MKKLLKIFGILFVSFFLLLLILPYFFKDTLFQLVKDESNALLQGELAIHDFNLSLISSFPNLSMELEGLSYTGVEPFKNEKLFSIGAINVELDLFSAISGSQYEVKSITITDADIDVKVLKDGIANYDILTPSEEEPEVENAEPAEPFNLTLKHFSLQNINLSYLDEDYDILFKVEKMNHTLSGNFGDAVVNMKTQTDWKSMTTSYEGVTYLNAVHGDANLDLNYNTAQEIITFGENNVQLNYLNLGFVGSVGFVENGYELDLAFETKENDFKNLMSLIPAVYMSDFNSLETRGKFSLNGTVKGPYLDTSDDLPNFGLNINAKEGSIHYPDLPSSLEKVALDLNINHPGGDLNNLTLDLKHLYLEAAGDPFSAKLKLKNTMTDPYVDGMLKGTLNLDKWNSIVELEDPISGVFRADAIFKGKQSDFENNNLNKVTAEGTMQLNHFKYFYADYNLPITIDSAKVALSPNRFDMPYFVMHTKTSDYSANGKIDNAFGWYLADEPLSGTFTMNSHKIDLNEFMGEETLDTGGNDSTSTEEEPYEIIRVPNNIDFVIRMTVDEMLYEEMLLENVTGKVTIEKGIVTLDPLNMNFMEGAFALKGDYDATQDIPKTSFEFQIKQLPMPSAMDLSMVSSYLPIAKNVVGNLNSSLRFSTQLNEEMMPILNSLNGKGVLKTQGLSYSSQALSQIDKLFNSTDLTKITFEDPNLSFSIKDGKLSVKPIGVKLGSQRFTLSGSHGLDQTLNYKLESKVAIKDIKLPKELSMLNLGGSSSIDFALLVTGTSDKPIITPKFGDIALGDIGKALLTEAKDSVMDMARVRAQEEAERLLKEAQKQADALMVEANKQAKAVKAEAAKQADVLKAEAQKQADKLVAETNDPFARIAAEAAAKEFIKQANREIDKLNVEADQQADALLVEAKKQSDNLLESARKEADALLKEK